MNVWKCAYIKPGGGIEILECVFKRSRSSVEPERGEQMMNIGGLVSQSKAMAIYSIFVTKIMKLIMSYLIEDRIGRDGISHWFKSCFLSLILKG